jgi:hypothetical protein
MLKFIESYLYVNIQCNILMTKFVYKRMQRFEIVNGIAEVEGAAKETPADAEVVAMDLAADKAKAEGILT